ncbi:MAG: hypothetical protein ACPGID_08655 [Rubricella sp.]
MKRLTITGLVAALPGVALAHEGAHLHPHGAEFGIGAMLLALLVGAAAGALIAIRVRK